MSTIEKDASTKKFDDEQKNSSLHTDELRFVLDQLYTLANSLHSSGLWQTHFNANVYNHKRGFKADLTCSFYEGHRLSINANFFQTKYQIKFSNGSQRTIMPDELEPKILVDEIKKFIFREIDAAFRKGFDDEHEDPIEALVQSEHDAYGIAARIRDLISENSGRTIHLFNDFNAPAEPESFIPQKTGFWKSLAIAFRLVAKPPPPPPLIYSPSTESLPGYYLELPAYIEERIPLMPDKHLEQEAKRALNNVETAISLAHKKADDKSLTTTFNVTGRRKLKQDLAIINNGIKEFDFSKPTNELTAYFSMVNNLLETHIEDSQFKNEIGMSVALTKLKSRILPKTRHASSDFKTDLDL